MNTKMGGISSRLQIIISRLDPLRAISIELYKQAFYERGKKSGEDATRIESRITTNYRLILYGSHLYMFMMIICSHYMLLVGIRHLMFIWICDSYSDVCSGLMDLTLLTRLMKPGLLILPVALIFRRWRVVMRLVHLVMLRSIPIWRLFTFIQLCYYTLDSDHHIFEDPGVIFLTAMTYISLDEMLIGLHLRLNQIYQSVPPKDYFTVCSLKLLHEADQMYVNTEYRMLSLAKIPKASFYNIMETDNREELIEIFDSNCTIIQVGSSLQGAASCHEEEGFATMDTDILSVIGDVTLDDFNASYKSLPEFPGWFQIMNEKFLFNIDKTMDILIAKKNNTPLHIDLGRKGPSMAMNYTIGADGKRIKSIDWVLAFHLNFWPTDVEEWLHRERKWPSHDVIDNIHQQMPIYLVNKPPSPKLEDRDKCCLSFTVAEQLLSQYRMQDMNFTYFCFKTIFYSKLYTKFEHKEFGSYLAKTCMMWAAEELAPEEWNVCNLAKNISYLLQKLLSAIQAKQLAHYFMPDMNLLRDLPDDLLEAVFQKMEMELVLNPLSYQQDTLMVSGEHIIGFFLHEAVFQKYRNNIDDIFDIIGVFPDQVSCNKHEVQAVLETDWLHYQTMVNCLHVLMMSPELLKLVTTPPDLFTDCSNCTTNNDHIRHVLNRSYEQICLRLFSK